RGGQHPATVEEMRDALRDDLDTARALEALDAWAEGTTDPEADASATGPGDVPAALDALFGITLEG
ncbi:MAG TPA: cysteine--1-D-myo-inosityl 2-amino-2-deoxy-alpha-D-glucopyranoside ligase, partial [Brevibacterium sp.]|nr:cysteine--1-D-myo-inosityl 2-amino-2-deoxy-alpha-D-glucopyranoside ligase [Brevibacterium sp.]